MMYYVAHCKDYLFAFAWFVNKVGTMVQTANIFRNSRAVAELGGMPVAHRYT